MDKKDEKKGKKCFIITPIGNENTDVFRKAKGVIESAIKPILKKYGFDDIEPAYEINLSGMITTQIINRIIEDDLVIVNLTGNNPNVMYELCLRHVVAKPIIHICEKGTSLPFDIKDSRTIFYENDMMGVEELKGMLCSFLDNISYTDDYVDNPIYVAKKYNHLLKETQGTEENVMFTMLINISNEISELKSSRKEEMNSSKRWDYERIMPPDIFEAFISSVHTPSALDYLSSVQEKVKIREAASALGVPVQVLMIIAEIVGVNVKASNMTITKRQLERIIAYIMGKK